MFNFVKDRIIPKILKKDANSKNINFQEVRNLISDWLSEYPYDSEEDFVSVFNYKYPIDHFIFSGSLIITISENIKLIVVERIENTLLRINDSHSVLFTVFLKDRGCNVPSKIQDWTDEECLTVTNLFKS